MTTPPSSPPPNASSPDPSRDPSRELVDRLVDGTLDARGRAQLSLAMERDAALKRDADELEGVNQQLRAFFGNAPRMSVSTPTVEPSSMAAPAPSVFSRRAVLGLLAACLVLGVVVGLMFANSGPTGWAREARDLYRNIQASGFKPQVVCTTPEQFAQWTGDNLGEALAPKLGVAGLELVGWNTSTTFSPYTGILIARVESQGVIVMLDREARVEGEGVKDLGRGLRAFPGKIGTVGVVEVTPFDSARVIPTITPAKP